MIRLADLTWPRAARLARDRRAVVPSTGRAAMALRGRLLARVLAGALR
ncbi:MAG: hypothetical protein ACRELS_17920 [Candidatus Rokuibacteriota bacterium]